MESQPQSPEFVIQKTFSDALINKTSEIQINVDIKNLFLLYASRYMDQSAASQNGVQIFKPSIFITALYTSICTGSNFCIPFIIFANSLDSNQARQKVSPDQNPNSLIYSWYS